MADVPAFGRGPRQMRHLCPTSPHPTAPPPHLASSDHHLASPHPPSLQQAMYFRAFLTFFCAGTSNSLFSGDGYTYTVRRCAHRGLLLLLLLHSLVAAGAWIVVVWVDQHLPCASIAGLWRHAVPAGH